jgi:hypothetical protein
MMLFRPHFLAGFVLLALAAPGGASGADLDAFSAWIEQHQAAAGNGGELPDARSSTATVPRSAGASAGSPEAGGASRPAEASPSPAANGSASTVAAEPAEPGAGAAPIIRVPDNGREDGFQWGSATRQSARFLAVEHGFRILTQQETRTNLRGPLFKDYVRSVKGLRGWDDGDSFWANYVGHPMQGAISGYIQIHNDPKGMYAEFGSSPHYWKSRLRAMAWNAAYSTQYELGPLGEAMIGNVGLVPGSKGFVDLVITPTAGAGWLVTEDAVDRYLIRYLERRVSHPVWRAVFRGTLNPSRSFSNVLRGRYPWYRDTRPGVHRYTP